MPKEYSASELFILQFFADVIRSHPSENVFELEQIERQARKLAIPTHDFQKAWQSLLERGYLARMDDGTAAITNTCATFVRHAGFSSSKAQQPYLP